VRRGARQEHADTQWARTREQAGEREQAARAGGPDGRGAHDDAAGRAEEVDADAFGGEGAFGTCRSARGLERAAGGAGGGVGGVVGAEAGEKGGAGCWIGGGWLCGRGGDDRPEGSSREGGLKDAGRVV
jgi:hypothetical protein